MNKSHVYLVPLDQADCEYCLYDESCSEHQSMLADRAKDEEEYFNKKP